MFESCLEKQKKVKALFNNSRTDMERYEKLIELGKLLPKLDPALKTEENRVKGCQSQMYLIYNKIGDKLYFEAESDAQISSGLAYIMISAYSGEDAETILKCPPTFLTELKIAESLSANRANGLYSLYTKMKQDALQSLL